MYGSAAKPVLRRFLTALLTLCVFALGFAPHAPRAQAPASSAALAAAAGIDLSLYTLPDGTVPDLCLALHSGVEGEEGHGAHEGPHCPACTLTKTIPARPPAAAAGVIAYAKAYSAPAPEMRALPQMRASPHWARGPPPAAPA